MRINRRASPSGAHRRAADRSWVGSKERLKLRLGLLAGGVAAVGFLKAGWIVVVRLVRQGWQVEESGGRGDALASVVVDPIIVGVAWVRRSAPLVASHGSTLLRGLIVGRGGELSNLIIGPTAHRVKHKVARM